MNLVKQCFRSNHWWRSWDHRILRSCGILRLKTFEEVTCRPAYCIHEKGLSVCWLCSKNECPSLQGRFWNWIPLLAFPYVSVLTKGGCVVKRWRMNLYAAVSCHAICPCTVYICRVMEDILPHCILSKQVTTKELSNCVSVVSATLFLTYLIQDPSDRQCITHGQRMPFQATTNG